MCSETSMGRCCQPGHPSPGVQVHRPWWYGGQAGPRAMSASWRVTTEWGGCPSCLPPGSVSSIYTQPLPEAVHTQRPLRSQAYTAALPASPGLPPSQGVTRPVQTLCQKAKLFYKGVALWGAPHTSNIAWVLVEMKMLSAYLPRVSHSWPLGWTRPLIPMFMSKHHWYWSQVIRGNLYSKVLLLLLLSHFSCVRLRDPIDSSPPGSSVPGILQARNLEWVAISFSSTQR